MSAEEPAPVVFADTKQSDSSPGRLSALTLIDCYKCALKQSETIAVRKELIAETEGRFMQALSGVLPKVTFSSSDKRQDGSGGSQFTLREVPERKFFFSQPLFSGFKEFAALAGSKAEKQLRTHEKLRAEQLLFLDVADAFTLLSEQRHDMATLKAIQMVLAERIEELKDRERLGRSRSSEVVNAQAQFYRTEAELELVKSRELVARQLLEFLTGLEKIEKIQDEDPIPLLLEKEQLFLEKAVSRSDVNAAKEEITIAEQQVRVARAKFWPTVGLEGNYYVERAGVSKEVDWDATLKVDVPIFQGGAAVGASKEAVSRLRQARLRFSETRRRAIQDVRDARARVEAELGRSAALARALNAAEENYRLQMQDYRLNLVNNIEVLDAIREFQDTRRDFIHAQYEARRLYWRLKVSTGDPAPL